MSHPVVATRSGDPYRNPELFRWVGSMEGVPEWVDPSESAGERAAWWPWQHTGNRWFESAGALVPGLVLALALAFVGLQAADWLGIRVLGFARSPLSPILVAIGLGLVIRNAIGLPSVYEPGLQLALKKILRIGVALLGLRLSLVAAGTIGLAALPIVIGCIAAALLVVTWVNRTLGLPARLGTLVAVGTAICGNTAIVATAPAIGAEDDEVSYAVGCITIFGLLAMLGYPYLAHWWFAADAHTAGFFLGTAIHDTAQVAGAGLVYLQQYGRAEALDSATVTKLVRNMFMLAVVPGMALLYRRQKGSPLAGRASLRQAVPVFVLGFVALTGVRTLGDLGERPFGLLAPGTWDAIVESVGELANGCLIVAMASVGLGTSFARLRNLGARPLAVGFAAALLVGVASLTLIRLLEPGSAP